MMQNDENYRDVKLRYQNPENRVEIYSAFELHRGKEVMIKRISCENESDAEFYMVEGQNTISERHPNICECYDVYVEQDTRRLFWRAIIVMEKLHTDLFEEIEERRPRREYIPENRVYTMICELVGALAYLQRKNLAHRDIKPHNIFLDLARKAKLGDFGSSKENKLSPSGIGQHTMQGTPLYLSPRIREAYAQSFAGPVRKVDHNIYKSDVYSLGLTMLHAMTLNPPADLAVIRGLEEKIDRALLSIDGYRSVKPIVARMLIVNEDHRPDFLELDCELNGEAPPVAVIPPVANPRSPSLVPQGPSVYPRDPSLPVRDEIPPLTEGACHYCNKRTEVFQLCHSVCFECFTETAQTQARLEKATITCRCGNEFPMQLLAIVLEPEQLHRA